MNDLIHIATRELAGFLSEHLPMVFGEDWWNQRVVEHSLTFQQQRIVNERELKSLNQLDFAALLRVFDRNWRDLSQTLNLPWEGFSWLKELQNIRNRWAHLSAQTVAASDIYRDADTLERFFKMIDSDLESIEAVMTMKRKALNSMTSVHSATENSSMPDSSLKDPDDNFFGQKDTAPPIQQQPKFEVGDLVELRSDTSILAAVLKILPSSPEPSYLVFYDGKTFTCFESQLIYHEESLELPRLTAEELRSYLTSVHLLSPSMANLYSLRLGRVQFVPYQYRPVLKLIRADRPRLLIADEVGVGKTIEAGLIIKELRARMNIASVLVICPRALVAERKWYLEMKRFDEIFTALDGPTLRHCLQETHLDGKWPSLYAKAILPFSLFNERLLSGYDGKGRFRARTKGLFDLDPPPMFDLVIVDEAHHIRNSETYLHQGVRYFCDHAQAAVFLTATPVQLGSDDLFILLNALRPDLVIDRNSFEQMAEPNRHINTAIQHCRSKRENWQIEAAASLDDVAKTRWGRIFLRESPNFQDVYDQLQGESVDNATRIGIIRVLEDLYTFSQIINRTRRRDIGEFTTRKPQTVEIKFTPQQSRIHNELLAVMSRILEYRHGQKNVKFMMTTIRRQAASCLNGLAPLLREILDRNLNSLETIDFDYGKAEINFNFLVEIQDDIEALVSKAESLDSQDPKLEKFIKILRAKNQMPKNKVLVFSTFRHTLTYLEEHVRAANLRYGLVHGGVSDDDRAELRRRFRLEKQDPKALEILLSSEIGSEGLDFEFCDLLINYDLPWNPMRIEQRIGRIDRYGQTSVAIAIVNMITPKTVDADIYSRCLWRIGVFHHSIGGNEEILGEITKEIQNIAEDFNLTDEERTQRLQQLADNRIQQVQEEINLEERQAELFGLQVPNKSWRQEIQAAENHWLSSSALQRCVSIYLSKITGSKGGFLLGEKSLKSLRLNRQNRAKLLADFEHRPQFNDRIAQQWRTWLEGPVPNLPVTFDQETAAAVPRAVYLNILHPLVRQAAKDQKRSSVVTVNLVVTSEQQPVGEYPFALYIWRKSGVRDDDSLIAITTDRAMNSSLMSLLIKAREGENETQIIDSTLDELEKRHYEAWSVALADHREDNRIRIEHLLQSLDISHKSRCNVLEDQIEGTTDDRICRMKLSELARAQNDYEQKVTELEKAKNSADIVATKIVWGVLMVFTEENK